MWVCGPAQTEHQGCGHIHVQVPVWASDWEKPNEVIEIVKGPAFAEGVRHWLRQEVADKRGTELYVHLCKRFEAYAEGL